MTSRERVYRSLEFRTPDRAPRDLWNLGGVALFHADDLAAVREQFPSDFDMGGVKYGPAHRYVPLKGDIGSYVDAWGCGWHIAEPGVAGEVKEPPIREWSDLASYQPPWELIREADFSGVNEFVAKTDKFTRTGTEVRPFERMQFLRGSEQLFMDLAYGDREVYELRDMLHEFFCEELRMWAATDVEGIGFMDDWGTQRSLLISPQMWRDFYKPLYAEYTSIIRGAGKKVFFHSDGFIEDIYPDLIEIGVDAVNSQLFCMDIEGLAEKYKGKITFWGEIDRQYLMPFGSTEEVRDGVRRVRHALDDGTGGVMAQCEWGVHDPKENIVAVFDEWDHPLEERL
jgi:uroporphyrinogen decarboxylase